MADKPIKVILRTYEVGFGDCFLLTFKYAVGEKHILIDFGSTGLPEGTPKDQMQRVAKDIALRSKNQLDIVVASHRHKDHISGFATDNAPKTKGKGKAAIVESSTGDIIGSCNPKIIIQPWTEDPDLAPDAKSAPLPASAGAAGAGEGKALSAVNLSFTQSLRNMNMVSEAIGKEVSHLADPGRFHKTLDSKTVSRLDFLADNNGVKNPSAVENLNHKMSGKRLYVNYGYPLDPDLGEILPGVKVRVLGPPNVDQYSDIEKERSSDREEFWMLYAATAEMRKELLDSTIGKDKKKEDDLLFPGANEYQRTMPDHSRWFVRRLRNMRADQLFQIVRILDDAMNNTSVILMFEVGKQKLLFPGDAQIENWEYALKVAPDCQDNINLLKDTTLYKVGHHGSRNATPKKLWNTFDKATEDKSADRLRTVVSTMAGKHGSPDRQTEVPRQTLVDALTSSSDYYSTQDLEEKRGLYHDIEIDL
ncbi:MAG TPA: hypothetical protein VGO50_07845 [Pyrinomonadaceae bacterium]|jgi:hypothetical protein|nr:hypothetical protein [Pyrinomonadaceae bacterium]